MNTPMEPLSLDELSSIRVRFFRSHFHQERSTILVAQFAGTYWPGSLGGPDARYMLAMGEAGVRAWEPDGLILDLTELKYDWGNDLKELINIGHRCFGIESLPLAIIVGPGCEAGVRSLLISPGIPPDSTMTEFLFRDLRAAFEYLDEEIRLQLRRMGFDEAVKQ